MGAAIVLEKRGWIWHEETRFRASLVPQMVKNLPAMRETWVRSLCGEDPLEKGMATHSSILAWRIPLMAEPGNLRTSSVTIRITLFKSCLLRASTFPSVKWGEDAGPVVC